MNHAMLLTAVCSLLFCSNLLAEEIWHVKAVDSSGQFLNVKAIDADGKLFDIKALEEENGYVLDVKALGVEEKWPVKVLASRGQFADVKAIRPDGTIVDIKALMPGGKRLDVKGVNTSGNIIHIKAIGPGRTYYGVKAVSKQGELHDIKGVKFTNLVEEGKVNDVAFHAHVKALVPGNAQGPAIWHVKAIHPDGNLLKLKVVDKDGQQHDVKAFATPGNTNMLDIKAFVGDDILPVKVLKSDQKFSPVKALGKDGTIYDIKAIMPDNAIIDVKGVERAGSIIHIKAIGPDGNYFGVKACSRAGQFYDVKGVKSSNDEKEGTANGVPFYAHLKAMPQLLGGR